MGIMLAVGAIYETGITSNLTQFIDTNIWDEAIIIKNENLVLENGTKAPNFDFEPIIVEDFRNKCQKIFGTKTKSVDESSPIGKRKSQENF